MVSKRKSLIRTADEKAAEGIAKVFDVEPLKLKNDNESKVKNSLGKIAGAAIQGTVTREVKRRLPLCPNEASAYRGYGKGDDEPEL